VCATPVATVVLYLERDRKFACNPQSKITSSESRCELLRADRSTATLCVQLVTTLYTQSGDPGSFGTVVTEVTLLGWPRAVVPLSEIQSVDVERPSGSTCCVSESQVHLTGVPGQWSHPVILEGPRAARDFQAELLDLQNPSCAWPNFYPPACAAEFS
jgi:hypothetical protein